MMPPPVPLVPPSLFGGHPSMPELSNPGLSDWYWYRNKIDPLRGGDYYRSTGLGGLNGLLMGTSTDITDKSRLKKELYRHDLLT
jgi:hypothetical protein